MNVIEQYIRDVLEGGQRKKGTILSALETFKKFNAWRQEAGKGEKPGPDHETNTRAYVDFDADALVITGAKGGKSRNVPLHPLLRAALEQRWGHVSTYGFLSREWVYQDYNHSRRVMDRLMKAAISDRSRHVFRKTALTWMDRHGVRDIVAKAIVGHAAQGVTQVHYLSVDDAEKVAAIRSLYAGELDGTEAPAPTVLHKNGNGGLDASGLTPEQRAAIER